MSVRRTGSLQIRKSSDLFWERVCLFPGTLMTSAVNVISGDSSEKPYAHTCVKVSFIWECFTFLEPHGDGEVLEK